MRLISYMYSNGYHYTMGKLAQAAAYDLEKQRNNEMQLRIMELESKLNQMSMASQVPETPKTPEVEVPKGPETPKENPQQSKLEMMFQQAMSRMSDLENQLKNQTLTQNTLPASQQTVPVAVHGKTDSAQNGKPEPDDVADEDSGDESEEEDPCTITTPDGVTDP